MNRDNFTPSELQQVVDIIESLTVGDWCAEFLDDKLYSACSYREDCLLDLGVILLPSESLLTLIKSCIELPFASIPLYLHSNSLFVLDFLKLRLKIGK